RSRRRWRPMARTIRRCPTCARRPTIGCWWRGTCSSASSSRPAEQAGRLQYAATRRREMNRHAVHDFNAQAISGGVATDQRHDSAHKHVTGEAVYIDDMPEPAGTLHGCLGLSTVAHGTILSMDLLAVRAAPGVVDVLTAADVPGENDISPTGRNDEPVMAGEKVEFFGQPVFAVIAMTREE